jgi:hypothetical protein
MLSKNKISRYLESIGEVTVLVDGHDDAIVGLTYDNAVSAWRVVYDSEKILNKLTSRDGMTYEEAVEYYDYNIAGSGAGSMTPIFIQCEF